MPAGLLDIPDRRQQKDFDCGAGVLAALYSFHGIHKPVSYFRAQLGCSGLDGTDPRTLEGRLRADDFHVLSGCMEIPDLRWLPRQMRPVIALIQSGGVGHYVLCRGVARRRVHYLCPIDGLTSLGVDEFDAAWVDKDRFGVELRRFGLAAWL